MSKASFKVFVERYGPQVLNTAVRVLGDAERAQDVHQDVFLAIWRRWDKYDGQVNWSAYLYRTTVRKALKVARARKTESLDGYDAGLSCRADRPDGKARAMELRKRLNECLTKLPKRQADTFALSRFEGLRAVEIAEIIGCSQETVRVHLHRAMKRLAEELSDYLG